MKEWLGCALLVLSPVFIHATDYKIDPDHSAAQFSVRHLGVSTVRGQFTRVTGTVTYDPNNLAASSVDAVVDATTVDTRVAGRDADLKSDDFFDVARYPTITFKSREFFLEGGTLKVKGELTMHGVTKEVILAVDGPTAPIKDSQGNQRVGASVSTRINRKDFGLNWNAAVEGVAVVSDDVNITIDLEAVQKKGDAGAGKTR